MSDYIPRAASPNEIRKVLDQAQWTQTAMSDEAFHDEAALRAMQVLLPTLASSYKVIVSTAFDMADAMLKERNRHHD